MPHTNVLESELAVLVIVDVQAKMLPAIGTAGHVELVANLRRLVRAARLLDVPILYTEQYPKGLGETVGELRGEFVDGAAPIIKSTCSCWRDDGFRAALQATRREHVILAGIEAHVCIQQTALDLLRVDYVPFVPVDAIGSRRALDMETAVERMRQAGVVMSTVESLLFELIERCDHPRFKAFLELVR